MSLISLDLFSDKWIFCKPVIWAWKPLNELEMKLSDWNIKKRIASFKYAFQGIADLFSQPNACIHLAVTFIVLICGFWLELLPWEWCVVALCIGAVLMAEAFNSAIEALADKVSPEFHPLVKRGKDLAAGAVLLMVFGAVAAGLVIFLPKFISLL